MPGVTFLPSSDSKLLTWSNNFKTLITATPTAYGLTAALATAYGVLHDAYAAALNACEPSIRNKGTIITKNEARTSLKTDIRLLASLVNGTASVTDTQKSNLGLNVRAIPQPIPAPTMAPIVNIVSVTGWSVKVKLKAATGSKRGFPKGVSGATILSYVGPTPPSNPADFKFEGNVGRNVMDIAFSTSLPAGTKVFVTAFFFNGRKQSGPACAPVASNLLGSGSVLMAA